MRRGLSFKADEAQKRVHTKRCDSRKANETNGFCEKAVSGVGELPKRADFSGGQTGSFNRCAGSLLVLAGSQESHLFCCTRFFQKVAFRATIATNDTRFCCTKSCFSVRGPYQYSTDLQPTAIFYAETHTTDTQLRRSDQHDTHFGRTHTHRHEFADRPAFTGGQT